MRRPPRQDHLAKALIGFRGAFAAVSAMSGVVNVLALTGSFYMLQVYDRVLTSHSIPTLIALTVIAVGLYLFQGILDVIRGQVLVRLGSHLDRQLTPLVHSVAVQSPLRGATRTEALQPIRDVDAIRVFLSSQGPLAIFDLPWMPIYLAFVFLMHPWLGVTALAGAVVLIALTYLTERLTRDLQQATLQAAGARMAIADANVRNAEVLIAMGIGRRAAERYSRANAAYLANQARASDIGGNLGGVSKVARMILQSAILGLGAYLSIRGELDSWRDHCRVDRIVPSACANRARDRALEELRRRSPELCSPSESTRRSPRVRRSATAPGAHAEPLSRRCDRSDSRNAATGPERRELRAQSRPRAWRDWPERSGKVHARARYYWIVAAGAGDRSP